MSSRTALLIVNAVQCACHVRKFVTLPHSFTVY